MIRLLGEIFLAAIAGFLIPAGCIAFFKLTAMCAGRPLAPPKRAARIERAPEPESDIERARR